MITFISGSGSNIRARGKIVIGQGVQIAQYVSMIAGQYIFTDSNASVKEQGFTSSSISIGKNAWLGASVIVLPGRNIGEGAIVGAGSVVTKDVPTGTICAGNPVKLLKKRV